MLLLIVFHGCNSATTIVFLCCLNYDQLLSRYRCGKARISSWITLTIAQLFSGQSKKCDRLLLGDSHFIFEKVNNTD